MFNSKNIPAPHKRGTFPRTGRTFQLAVYIKNITQFLGKSSGKGRGYSYHLKRKKERLILFTVTILPHTFYLEFVLVGKFWFIPLHILPLISPHSPPALYIRLIPSSVIIQWSSYDPFTCVQIQIIFKFIFWGESHGYLWETDENYECLTWKNIHKHIILGQLILLQSKFVFSI